MIPIKESRSFTNGSIEDLDTADLMRKVAESGQSLHTIREYNDNIYIIDIFYDEWFGGRGIDNPDELYWIDIVVEYPNGKQERLGDYKSMTKLKYNEVINYLNQWKEKTINR